ncbi:putative surface protein [Candidatus Termititenax persephonae]|uniref:Surface protein n=1 Tax=Candidatus Termititenax persephonae TaxID=2218525 RepID=A0A388TJ67_9BACT|nr:putative surface protein [Candidatus Termititenax persephonae]
MRKLLFLILLGGLLLAAELPNAPILRLAVSGNRVYSAEDIFERAGVRTRRGALLDYPVLQEDLTRLMALGGFRSVDAEIASFNRGLQVTFLVEENPIIKHVEFIGNRSLRTERIFNFWQNRPGEQLNYLTLGQDIESLNRLYRQEGYELSSVQKVELTAGPTLRAEISEPIINEIIISGNAYVKDALILRELSLYPGSVYNARELAADRVRVFRLGYFSSVSLPKVTPAEDPGQVDIYLTVQERKKYFKCRTRPYLAGAVYFHAAELRQSSRQRRANPNQYPVRTGVSDSRRLAQSQLQLTPLLSVVFGAGYGLGREQILDGTLRTPARHDPRDGGHLADTP